MLFQIIALAAALIGVGFILGIHELGHFLCAKLFDVKTRAFSIGFGPRILSKQIGETEFALSAIPLGAYVEMADGEGTNHADSRLFLNKPAYQKIIIMLGGIGFNLIFAYLAFIWLAFAGLPNTPMLYHFNAQPVVAKIAPDSPAAQSGMQEGDTILKVNDIAMKGSALTFHEALSPLAGQTVTLLIERGGKEQEIPVTLEERILLGKKIGSLGVMLQTEETPGVPFFEALKKGISISNAYIAGTAKMYLSMFRKRDISGLSGPLMIVSIAMQSVAAGLKIFLLLLALISIGLAILNLIPLPILDGGQVLIYLIELIIRRPLPIRMREYIAIASWLLILALFIYITFSDATQLAGPYLQGLKTKIGLG